MTDFEEKKPFVLDFERMCRACKSATGDMYDVFTNTFATDPGCPRFDEMLMACTSLKIRRDDGLPNLICERCINSLKLCFDFKVLCERTDTELRQAAGKLRNDEINATISEIEDMIDFGLARHRAFVRNELEFGATPPKILACGQCSKVFATVEGLDCHKRFLCEKHLLANDRKKAHVCKICNKTVTRYQHLKRHLVTHLKEKPFTCERCTRGFNRAEYLANHVGRCKGQLLHICDFCNKGFNTADSLDVHKRMHVDEDPVLLTLDNLDNIEEHYIEIDHDDKNGEDDDGGDYEDLFEPVVEMLINDLKSEEEVLEETMKLKFQELEGESRVVDEYENNNSDSAHSGIKIEIKEEEESFACSVSNEEINKVSLLEKHASQHVRAKAFECSICKKAFKRAADVRRHKASHLKRKFKCSICPKTFCSQDHLTQHTRLHSRAERKHVSAEVFECSICKAPFTRASDMRRHEASHLERKFTCSICPKTFYRQDHLTLHTKLHSSVKRKHASQHVSAKVFECSICKKSYTRAADVRRHMKVHVSNKKFECEKCDKTFLLKSRLNDHTKTHNEHSKKFLCSECGQRFFRHDYLVEHMRRHRGEKPFACKFCGKDFTRISDLREHERYHTGEKTHLCVICGRGFGRASGLTVHMRTHTGEKPYQCTYCDTAYAQSNDLKVHIRRHTGERFQCDLCSEAFILSYLLNQHRRTVHGLTVESNVKRLEPVENPDEPPPTDVHE